MSKDLTGFQNPSGLDNAEGHELEERIAENVTLLLKAGLE